MRFRFGRRRETQQAESTITLSLAEACHCLEALGYLGATCQFADVFEDQFVAASTTFAKLSRLIEPATHDDTSVLIAEADRFAAWLADPRSQHR